MQGPLELEAATSGDKGIKPHRPLKQAHHHNSRTLPCKTHCFLGLQGSDVRGCEKEPLSFLFAAMATEG